MKEMHIGDRLALKAPSAKRHLCETCPANADTKPAQLILLTRIDK